MNQPRMTEKSPVMIDTSVENVRDAVVRAGFRPGRRVRVSVMYTDAQEAREDESRRLSAILEQYPLPTEFQQITEEQAASLADEAVSERRSIRRKLAK